MKYFAWITGLRGPEGQLWYNEPVDGNGKPRLEVIFKIKLTEEEEKLSLDELRIKYANSCKPLGSGDDDSNAKHSSPS